MALYEEGFLDTLVSINFPSVGGYITVDVTARNEVVGIVPPFCPTASLVIPATAKLIDQRETCTKTTFPARTIFTRFRFIWPDGLAMPTVANYDHAVAGHLDFVYAQEFSNWIHIQGGGGGFPTALPQPYSSGYYPDDSSAAAAATAWNNAYGPVAAPLGYVYLPADGGPEVGPIFLGNMAAVFLDVPVIQPAFSRADLSRQYLVKTPRELMAATLSILETSAQPNRIDVKGYVGATPKTMSQVDPNGFTWWQIATGSGSSTYGITSQIIGSGPTRVNRIDITGP